MLRSPRSPQSPPFFLIIIIRGEEGRQQQSDTINRTQQSASHRGSRGSRIRAHSKLRPLLAPASPCARRTPLWPTEYASLSGWVLVSSKSLSGSLSGSGSTSAPSEVWSSRHPRRHRRSPVGRRQSLVSESHWFPSSFDTDPDSDFDIDAPTGASAPSSTLLPPELSFRPHSMR